MKITRSALKSLIKEEMNRINENTPVVASGQSTENVGDALVGMIEGDSGFDPILQGFVDGGQVEGLEELRNIGIVTRPAYGRVSEKRIRSMNYRLHLQWPKSGWQGEGGVFYVKVDEAAAPIRRPASMHRQSGPGGSGMPGDVSIEAWESAQAEIRAAMETFNRQNGGKGAMILVGGAPVAASEGYSYPATGTHPMSTWGVQIDFPISSEA